MDDGQGIIKQFFEFVGQHLSFFWFVLLATWGGTVAYLEGLKKHDRAFRLLELIMQWVVSGFAGLMTAYICAEIGLSFGISAVLVGMAGNMSSQAINLIRTWAMRRLPKDISKHIDRRHDDDEK